MKLFLIDLTSQSGLSFEIIDGALTLFGGGGFKKKKSHGGEKKAFFKGGGIFGGKNFFFFFFPFFPKKKKILRGVFPFSQRDLRLGTGQITSFQLDRLSIPWVYSQICSWNIQTFKFEGRSRGSDPLSVLLIFSDPISLITKQVRNQLRDLRMVNFPNKLNSANGENWNQRSIKNTSAKKVDKRWSAENIHDRKGFGMKVRMLEVIRCIVLREGASRHFKTGFLRSPAIRVPWRHHVSNSSVDK